MAEDITTSDENSEGNQAGTGAEETQSGPEYVNLGDINDVEKLREIQANPAKYTTEKPAPAAVSPKKDQEQQGQESGGESTNENEPDDEERDKDHGDEVARRGTRLKIKTSHLPEEQREVLVLVSKGKSFPAAQQEVVTNLVRAGKSLSEAETLVYGEAGRKNAPALDKEPKQESTPEDQKDLVAEKRSELRTLRADLEKARKDFDVVKIEEIRDKIDEAKDALRDLEDAAKNAEKSKEQAEEAQYAEAVAASCQRAINLFPDSDKPGTPLFEAISDEVEDLRETNPGFFDNPKWPETLAAVKAAELGIPSAKHKGGATPSQGEQKPPVPPKKQARPIVPASGASGGQSTTTEAADNPEAELEAAGTDPEKLNSWIRKYGRKIPNGPLSVADSFAQSS